VSDVVATNGTDPVTTLLMRAATDPAFDSQKFETAVAFVREREARAERRAYNEAMARISEKLDAIPKTGKNDYLKSRYAEKDAMLKLIKPIAAEYGVGIRFGSQPPTRPGLQCVTCITSLGAHEEITTLEGPVVMPAPSRDGKIQMTPIQAVGSTTTYLERYLLGMVFSLVLADEQDDDGEATRTDLPPPSNKRSAWQRNTKPPDTPRQPLPIPQTDEEWSTWLTRLRDACAVIYKRPDLVQLFGTNRIKAVIAASPTWAHDEIDRIAAENFERLSDEEPPPEETNEDDGLPPIVGEEKLGAG
jgi:hypothetical protein